MKKLVFIFAILIAILFASCKKEPVCDTKAKAEAEKYRNDQELYHLQQYQAGFYSLASYQYYIKTVENNYQDKLAAAHCI